MGFLFLFFSPFLSFLLLSRFCFNWLFFGRLVFLREGGGRVGGSFFLVFFFFCEGRKGGRERGGGWGVGGYVCFVR